MNKLMPLKYQVEENMKMLATHFPAPFARDDANDMEIAGIRMPRLYSGNTLLNLNYTEIDRFTSRTQATATLFVASGEDFFRIATSVKNQNGERAVGTALDRSHPGYQLLRSGQPYTGYATLFGKQYMSKYEPIRDDTGRIVGVLYVGLDVSEVFTLSIWARMGLLTFAIAFVVMAGYGALLDLFGSSSRSGTDGSPLSVIEIAGLALAGALLVGGLTLEFTRRVIGRQLLEAKAAAEKLATGDLTAQVRVDRRDELGQLLQAINSIGVRLSAVVMKARSNAYIVSSTSDQIAQGNDDLSVRTERQATALEETSASMEELGTTVSHNAESARQANQLAQNASAVAAKGGEVVGRVVETMKTINESSRRISDIVSVIDSIAFQTNILALNAAVEAARAGEQGRGFAVVAGEVRSLAGRCADAAKEIKGLIAQGMGRVEAGTALVGSAGSTMTEIVESVRRVTDLMGTISDASHEQRRGVAQAGEAIVQMEQMTQQNAALVEEMTAASTHLRNQAQDLIQAVAVFVLAQDQAARDATKPARSNTNTPAIAEPRRPHKQLTAIRR